MKNLTLLLAGLMLIFVSCNKQSEVTTGSDQPPVDPPSANLLTADAELEQLVNDFEIRINELRDKDLRNSLVQETAQIMRAFAEQHKGSAEAAEAWLYVMSLGSGSNKEMATKFLLAQVAAAPESDWAVATLGEIVTHGESNYHRNAIEQLTKLSQSSDPKVATESLVRLSTNQTLPESTRSAALKQWLSEYSDNELTKEIANLLNRTQCEFNEQGLKSLARNTAGEIKTAVVLILAHYINRRDSVREFYRDDPQNRRSELPHDLKAYFTATAPADEKTMLIGLLKSARSDLPEQIKNLKRELFVIENLTVGSQAPEIAGSDLDGVDFKLSDYRGQVVLLNFWGDW